MVGRVRFSHYVYRAGPVSPPRGALLSSQSWPPGRWPEKLLSVASSCQGRALTHLGPEFFVGEPRCREVQTKTAPVTAPRLTTAPVLSVDPAANFSRTPPRLSAAVMGARQSAATPVAGSAAVIAARQSAATPIAEAANVIAARQSAATPVAGAAAVAVIGARESTAGAAAVIAARESTAGAAAVIGARQSLPYPRPPNTSAAVDAARKRRRARRSRREGRQTSQKTSSRRRNRHLKMCCL